jgi:hypothetical protein
MIDLVIQSFLKLNHLIIRLFDYYYDCFRIEIIVFSYIFCVIYECYFYVKCFFIIVCNELSLQRLACLPNFLGGFTIVGSFVIISLAVCSCLRNCQWSDEICLLSGFILKVNA